MSTDTSRMLKMCALQSNTVLSRKDSTFRRETIDQYLKSPQFMQACELSESKLLPDGFAFAMVCEQTTVVSVFHFSKDMVSDEMATIIPAARQVQCPRA